MEKDFDNWNREKKKINRYDGPVLFHEREIWWCSIGLNVGDEQDGKNDLFERPVLVVKKFNKGLALVVPLSSQEKTGPYYFKISHDDKNFTIILSQVRLISTKRFQRKIRRITDDVFAEIMKELQKFFIV